MTEPSASDTAMAAATATAMYLLLKLAIVTGSVRACLLICAQS